MNKFTFWLLTTIMFAAIFYLFQNVVGAEPIVEVPEWLFRTIHISLGVGYCLIITSITEKKKRRGC